MNKEQALRRTEKFTGKFDDPIPVVDMDDAMELMEHLGDDQVVTFLNRPGVNWTWASELKKYPKAEKAFKETEYKLLFGE